jgi:hypothetical protein
MGVVHDEYVLGEFMHGGFVRDRIRDLDALP